MSNADPRGWLDKAVGACFTLLMGAAAVFIAVKLIAAVFTSLLVIIGVGFLIVGGVAAMRSRNRGW